MTIIISGGYKLRGKLKSERKKRNPIKTNSGDDLQSVEKTTRPNGCASAVKGLRQCFLDLLPEHTDNHFTGRLMKLVTDIYKMDKVGEKCRKSVLFSQYSPILGNIIFNIREKEIDLLRYQFRCIHDTSRRNAILKMNEFYIKSALLPRNITHYRIFNHLSIISDYAYSDTIQGYLPLTELNATHVISYTDYIDCFLPFTGEIVTSFPLDVSPSINDTIMQCIGIEFFSGYNRNNFALMKGGGVMVMDVF